MASGVGSTITVTNLTINGALTIGVNGASENGVLSSDIIEASNITIGGGATFNITAYLSGIKAGEIVPIILGNVSSLDLDNPVQSYTSNGRTITYAIATQDYMTGGGTGFRTATAGLGAPSLSNGLYGYILSIIDAINNRGMNAVFLANSLREAASINNEGVYKNASEGVWVDGNLSGNRLGDIDNRNFNSKGGGVQAGVKVLGNKEVSVGLYTGYESKHMEQNDDRGDSEDVLLGVYSKYEANKFSIVGAVNAGQHSIKAKNAIADAEVDINAIGIRLGVEAEYELGLLKPFVGLEGGYVTNEKGKEKVSGSETGDELKAGEYMRAKGLVGVKVGSKLGEKMGWNAKGYVGVLLAGDEPKYNEETIKGTKEKEMSFGVGAGIDYELTSSVNVYVGGKVDRGEDLFGYTANAGASYKF
ncbi:MAG: autotransporter outer membrane beta-barrel domain-containing protein [Elusimicrobiota bacterium]|jgi:hypothetical protein|nr:autotransporter outer membrane beta-barrel domain-containing protein [Elusimicrobiota bacterium]